jgi:integrase
MPLDEVFETYIKENPRIRSKETISLLRGTVKNFQDFLARPGTLSDLNNASLVAFMEYRKQLGRSPRTIEREASKLATLWRWAASYGWCEIPRFSVSKCAPPTPTAWSPEEMKMIFRAASLYRSSIGGLRGSLVLTAFIRLAYDTGERSAAIKLVRWADIDMNGRWVTYRAETRKGGVKAGDKVQKITRETVAALKALQDAWRAGGIETDRVFPQLHVSSFLGQFRLMLKATGLPSSRHDMLHKLRRTHATHLHVMGGDATASLGHESDQITRGYYLDPRYTRGGNFADLIGEGWFKRLRRRLKKAFGLL